MTSREELKVFLKDIADNHGYGNGHIEIKKLPSDGLTYTSIIYLVNVSAPFKDDLNLFVKVANLSKEFRAANVAWSNFFKLELIFYTTLVDTFKVIYDKYNILKEHRLNIPQYHGSVSEELQEKLALDNLEAVGYRSNDRKEAISLEYALKAIEQMAKLHSLGFAINNENPKFLENLIGSYEEDVFESESIIQVVTQQVNLFAETIQDEYKDRLKQCLASLNYLKSKREDKIALIHRDFKPRNLMHRQRNGELDIMVLDFQTYRRGNPVIDLLYFILMNFDEEFRRCHYQHLLEYYYTQLTLELQRLGLDADAVYPKRVFDQNIKELLPYTMMLVLGLVSAVTVDPEDAPSVTDKGVESLAVKINPRSLEKMQGILRDLVRWNII